MFTTIALIISIFFMGGGALNIFFNIRDFKEVISGVGTLFIGLILFLLCVG